ncbi:dihydroxyacetone kinase subunit DhaL [Wukongibacter baidiensis]|uniref:dihydroxyacetone kinase subunit DhaL n=1 Tax=Wukongibacter baidiensis TaxID=1723361 RepID=UPI003D7F32DE
MLTLSVLKNMLLTAAGLLKENSKMLSKLDSIIGDGDHGVTIKKIANVIEETVENSRGDVTIKGLLEEIGWSFIEINGGSAGPLWGTMFTGLADGIGNKVEIDEKEIKEMFISSQSAMEEISSARLGDKTMMDAFIPAVEALKNSNCEIGEMFEKVAEAAEEGAANTSKLIAKYGRAKNIKEKSIGHRDPGAVSLALLFKGFSQGVNK